MVLLSELVVLSVFLITSLTGALLALNHSFKSPIIEMKVLALGISSLFFTYVSFLPMILLSDDVDGISSLGLSIVRYAFVFQGLFFVCLEMVLLTPTMKFSYRSLLLIMTVTTVSVIFSISAYSSTDYTVKNGVLIPQVPSIASLTLLFSFVILTVLLVRRVRQINQLRKANDNFTISTRFVVLLAGSFVIGILTIPFLSEISGTGLPNLSRQFPVILILFIFIYSFLRDHYFLFTIPVKIESIVVTDKGSGLLIYSENISDDESPEVLISGLFTALNISLKEVVETQNDMEEINFGDKVVHLAPGSKVTTLLITSQKTLMTTVIAKYLTASFENKFSEILKNSDNMYAPQNFEDFNQIVDEIKPYFAF